MLQATQVMKPSNAVKESAAAGRTIRGIHLTFAAPAIIEVLAAADLQFVYIDGEHGCFDWRDIETACLAAERHGLTPIARVPDLSIATITRFLDRGVRGIVAPHIESVAEAREVVNAAYFAPLGSRSFGAGRPEYGRRIGSRPEYMEACNAALSLCLMIESRAGAKLQRAPHRELDQGTSELLARFACGVGSKQRVDGRDPPELAALPGVDYVSFGMLDLAQSLGHPGRPDHPAVQAAVADASARIRASGKPVREDFMKFVWINDVLMAGARALLDAAAK